MTPYYERAGITIYHADCLDVLRGMEAGIVIIADVPYGISTDDWMHKDSGKRRGNMLALRSIYPRTEWDSQRLDRKYIDAMLEHSKHQVIFGGNYYTDYLPASSSWIVWDKLNGANDFADCELAWTSHKRAARMFRYRWNGMIKQRPEKRYHPTQKPLALMLWIIENYTAQDDLICDPFMGSGTTLLAAKLLGRRAIGVDNVESYCKIATERLQADTLDGWHAALVQAEKQNELM